MRVMTMNLIWVTLEVQFAPDIRSFRELPQWMRDHKEEFMEKRVLTYCTGAASGPCRYARSDTSFRRHGLRQPRNLCSW